jgi:hypothetical protein
MALCCIVSYGLCLGCAGTAGVAAAKEEITRFHEQMNKGDITQLYQETDSEFKVGISLPSILKACAHIRQSLGEAKTSKITFASTEFGFGGQKVTLVCRTSFSKGSANESFVFRIRSGKAVVARYRVQFLDKGLQ